MQKLLKQRWLLLVQALIWLGCIVYSLATPYPYNISDDETWSWRLIQLVLLILSGLMLVATVRLERKKKSYLWGWAITTVLLAVVVVVLLLNYRSQKSSCVCFYEGDNWLIGTAFKDPEYDAGKTCQQALADAASAVTEVWTEDSIKRCQYSVGMSYVSTLPLLALFLISMFQTLRIGMSLQPDKNDTRTDAPVTGHDADPVGQPVPRWLLPAGFIIGILAIAVVLILIVYNPNPSRPQLFVFRILIALGGAAFSMSISGFVTIQLNLPSKGYIIAGGSLAVFIILFFFTPQLAL